MILPMPSCTLYKLTCVACTAALCTTAFLFAGANSQQGVPKSPASSATEAPVYFPPDMVDGFNGFFSHYLSRFGEPSLLAAAQDSSALSYRLDGQPEVGCPCGSFIFQRRRNRQRHQHSGVRSAGCAPSNTK